LTFEILLEDQTEL